MEEHIRTFAPLPGTCIHFLLDNWYGIKRLRTAA